MKGGHRCRVHRGARRLQCVKQQSNPRVRENSWKDRQQRGRQQLAALERRGVADPFSVRRTRQPTASS
jgi:hypothetical protein